MILSQDIQHVTTKYIPKAVTTAVLQGTAINYDGTVHTSTATGTGFLGLALSDLAPAPSAAPSIYCACPPDSRLMALATGGKLAIRVKDATNYAAITVGATFSILNGEAVSSGPAATTINGDVLVAVEKVVDGTGTGYVMVYMN
jgi:predicted RecA/RadA family phage recombinase